MGERPSLHKQLLFLPTAVGTTLFVMAGLNISGVMKFVAGFVLLLVTAIPFQHSYASLFPVQPRRLRDARLAPSAVLIAGQVLFWAGLFVLFSYWRSNRGT